MIRRLQSDLCERLLPFVVHEMLVRGSDSVRQSLSEQVGAFFERAFNGSDGGGAAGGSRSTSSSLSASVTEADFQPHANHRSIKCVLGLVHHLRQQASIMLFNTILTTILIINLHDRICLDTPARVACGRGTTGCPTSTTCTWRGRRSTARPTSRPSRTQTSGMLFSALLRFATKSYT